MRDDRTLNRDLDNEDNRSQHLSTANYVLGCLPCTVICVLANFLQNSDIKWHTVSDSRIHILCYCLPLPPYVPKFLRKDRFDEPSGAKNKKPWGTHAFRDTMRKVWDLSFENLRLLTYTHTHTHTHIYTYIYEVKVSQLYPTLCYLMDCKLTESFVRGIL